jgi:hypothetical protein
MKIGWNWLWSEISLEILIIDEKESFCEKKFFEGFKNSNIEKLLHFTKLNIKIVSLKRFRILGNADYNRKHFKKKLYLENYIFLIKFQWKSLEYSQTWKFYDFNKFRSKTTLKIFNSDNNQN